MTFAESVWRCVDDQKKMTDASDEEIVEFITSTAARELRRMKESGELDISYDRLEATMMQEVHEEMNK